MVSYALWVGLLVTSAVAIGTDRDVCPFDYTPCDCSSYNGGDFFVYCTGVQVEQIQAIFQQSTISNHRGIQLRGNYNFIPADLLADKTVTIAIIDCLTLFRLTSVDPDAFRASQDTLTDLELTNCELIAPQFNWNFLTGFSTMSYINVYNGPLETLETMPYLPTLYGIGIEATGFRRWYPPQQTPNLYEIGIRDIGGDQDIVESLLDDIVYLNQTLRVLTLWNVGLTRIPSQIQHLNRLAYWTIERNNIDVLETGSVPLVSNFQYLLNNGIHTIEPGAFRGDLTKSVDLSFNNLTTFEEPVFFDLLQNSGSVVIRGNPINCDCRLAWLIRDNPLLLARVSEGFCADLQVPFEFVDPNLFNDCP